MTKSKRQAATTKADLTPGYFLDLSVFWIGLSAFHELRGSEDPHIQKAVKALRRFQKEMVQGLNQFVEPLTSEGPFTRFKAELAQASRQTVGLDQALLQASLLSNVFSVLRARPMVLKTLFSEPRSASAAMKVANLATSDSPETILNGLATAPPASRLQITRKWLREACKLAGVAPSQVEDVITDAETARNLGEDLRNVEAQLASLDPLSQEARDLQEHKQDLLAQVDTVVSASSAPAVALSATAVAASQPKDYATKVGREKGLSPDQERAMMIRGRGIIAAGAGSGKTRVLASKVIYHMDELGVPPQAIMATSFSRKSAAELRKRIEDFGGNFPRGTDTGLGTTHSVAAKLTREYGRGSRDFMKNYEQTSLIRLAMAQVTMLGATEPPPEPSPVFDSVPSVPSDQSPEPLLVGLSFEEALAKAHQKRWSLAPFLRSFIEGFYDKSDRWYRMNRNKTKDLTDPFGLTDKQLNILKDVFHGTQVEYHPDRDPVLAGPTNKVAKKDKDKGLRDKYSTFTYPLNQWFNRGMHLTEDGQKEGKLLTPGHFQQAITKYKGRVISPTEAWSESNGAVEAAVYAAYEYLKGANGEQDFRGKGDFDDVLLDVSNMLLSNPTALRQVQSRFKVVLVDEAQDLNRAQHMMFGLVTGYVDPAKAGNIATVDNFKDLAKDDETMSADTYTFIGDDKQAIYEFRSADPETFIDMSNLVEGGAGFKTEILKTNYRSGAFIVQAANRLISHNKKQIPMVCDANPSRTDQGGISRIPFNPVEGQDMSAPATWLADHIQESMETGDFDKGYDSFGVGLRSNAEAYTYGIEMLKRGIPFRSKANFFNNPNTKALLYWLALANEGLNGDVDQINEAVLNARKAPTTMLGPKFADTVMNRAQGNYLVWLQDNWRDIYGPRSRLTQNVKSYLDNLLEVADLKEDPALSNESILQSLLDMQGFDGGTIEEALIERTRGDEDAMAEIRAANPDGEVQDEDVKLLAMAPIDPLKGLLDARPNLSEAMKYVRTLQSANDTLSASDDPNAPGFRQPAVTLGTMHSWKGLEVDSMYVPVVGGRFPPFGASEEDLASERRLGYVALTRGENNVYVMDIPTVRMTDRGPMVQQSPFIDEMCLTPTPGESGAGGSKMASHFPSGVSAHEPQVMTAYLSGKDPVNAALQLPTLKTAVETLSADVIQGLKGDS